MQGEGRAGRGGEGWCLVAGWGACLTTVLVASELYASSKYWCWKWQARQLLHHLHSTRMHKQGCQQSRSWRDTHAFTINLTLSRTRKKCHAKIKIPPPPSTIATSTPPPPSTIATSTPPTPRQQSRPAPPPPPPPSTIATAPPDPESHSSQSPKVGNPA